MRGMAKTEWPVHALGSRSRGSGCQRFGPEVLAPLPKEHVNCSAALIPIPEEGKKMTKSA